MVYPKTKRTGLENTMSELTLNHTARLTDALGATCSAAPSKTNPTPTRC